MQPSSAKPTMKLSTALTLNTFRRKRRSGRIGSAARCSAATKQPRKTTPADDQPDDRRRAPAVLDAAPARREDQPGGAERDEDDAEGVEDRAPERGHRREQLDRQRDDHQRDRHVDVEDPLPRPVVGEEAAEQRPEDRRTSEDGADRALVLAAVAQRDDVGDHRGRRHGQPAAADALQRARPDQPGHRLRETREHRGDREEHDAADEDRLAPEEVAELAAQDRRDRLGEEVRRHHPAHVLGTTEVADDRRQGGGDDGGVEGREEQAAHDQREGDVAGRRPERLGVGGLRRGRPRPSRPESWPSA